MNIILLQFPPFVQLIQQVLKHDTETNKQISNSRQSMPIHSHHLDNLSPLPCIPDTPPAAAQRALPCTAVGTSPTCSCGCSRPVIGPHLFLEWAGQLRGGRQSQTEWWGQGRPSASGDGANGVKCSTHLEKARSSQKAGAEIYVCVRGME